MIGLDTNVLVRLLTQDDPEQARRAEKLLAKQEGVASAFYVNQTVLVELAWTLRSAYDLPQTDTTRAVRALLENSAFSLEGTEEVRRALTLAEATGADFPDCLIVAKNAAAGCANTVTFDRDMQKALGAQPC